MNWAPTAVTRYKAAGAAKMNHPGHTGIVMMIGYPILAGPARPRAVSIRSTRC